MRCVHNRRAVSTARTRSMVTHGTPMCPATVAAADAFSNETDRFSYYDISFCILLAALYCTVLYSAGLETSP